ncbi:hypothetical protein DPMN_026235 [Dreissena polymorpha]|uniref:Uncharacterized protein n=1 Tax=Dreissena polymorpha TaxID=45954 RepID=A0A9D4LQS0_DREPO|nr:hypothetical protein DPMN_026235 [Dreissena polymorpha]
MYCHMSMSCTIHDDLGHQIWPYETTMQLKLYSSLEGIQGTASFAQKAGVCIRVIDKKTCQYRP